MLGGIIALIVVIHECATEARPERDNALVVAGQNLQATPSVSDSLNRLVAEFAASGVGADCGQVRLVF